MQKFGHRKKLKGAKIQHKTGYALSPSISKKYLHCFNLFLSIYYSNYQLKQFSEVQEEIFGRDLHSTFPGSHSLNFPSYYAGLCSRYLSG